MFFYDIETKNVLYSSKTNAINTGTQCFFFFFYENFVNNIFFYELKVIVKSDLSWNLLIFFALKVTKPGFDVSIICGPNASLDSLRVLTAQRRRFESARAEAPFGHVPSRFYF